MRYTILMLLHCICGVMIKDVAHGQEKTYAEKLGYPEGSKVLIIHVDDAGMSYEANEGTILSMEKGAANSSSVMMPCAWVPDYFRYLEDNPETDAGVHLTLTSEWEGYRWGPLSGKTVTPSLVDGEGAFWPSVNDVVVHGDPEEVYIEMKSQLERFRGMGIEPTHLDSHMGTVFESEAILEKYVQLGIESQIPVMLPGGHATIIQKETNSSPERIRRFQAIGTKLWEAGLPVLDDLQISSYGWEIPPGIQHDDQKLQSYKTEKFIEIVKSLNPGITQIIIHSATSAEHFEKISSSGPSRRGDMLAMMDPKFIQCLKDEGVIMATWRELHERRQHAGRQSTH